MSESSNGVRILALAQERLAQFRYRTTRNSGLLVALDARYNLVGAVVPRMGRVAEYAAILRYFYPDRDAWRQRAGLSPWTFRHLTAAAEERLRDWDGRYDLIMLVQTMFAPGRLARDRPYAVYTDNIHALTARYFPAWAPLSDGTRARRMQLERATCQAARRIFAKSEFLRGALIEEYRCDPERVVRVGVGTNSFVTSLEETRYDAQAALFVGVDFVRKGGAALLDAWPLVRAQLPEAELWIVGPKRRSPAAEQPGIRWFGFLADRSLLADLYAKATAFVLPLLFEPYGLSFFEAMGQGLPCIGTDRGAIKETIQAGENGLLVPAGEAEPLADALVTLLGDPERAARMGAHAHAEVLAEHTWERVADRMAPHIERIAAEPTRRLAKSATPRRR
jgi:glycosyltransferase involved in cell wall biosynthesis